jgi:hypothetical protein
MHQRMPRDRVDKLQAVVESEVAVAQSPENRVAAHKLTPRQAVMLLRDDSRVLGTHPGRGHRIG